MADHVHMMIAMPPKYLVAQVAGYISGKSTIHIAREFGGTRQNFPGQRFWALHYFVSSVRRDEDLIRNFIRHQEIEDRKQYQMELD